MSLILVRFHSETPRLWLGKGTRGPAVGHTVARCAPFFVGMARRLVRPAVHALHGTVVFYMWRYATRESAQGFVVSEGDSLRDAVLFTCRSLPSASMGTMPRRTGRGSASASSPTGSGSKGRVVSTAAPLRGVTPGTRATRRRGASGPTRWAGAPGAGPLWWAMAWHGVPRSTRRPRRRVPPKGS